MEAIIVENNEVDMEENQFLTNEHVKVCRWDDFDERKRILQQFFFPQKEFFELVTNGKQFFSHLQRHPPL